MKKPEIYVVIAYRWGDREKHSYTLGAFTKKQKAIDCAESHAYYRSGKYACVVEQCIIDNFDNKDDEYTKEIYRAKSRMEK